MSDSSSPPNPVSSFSVRVFELDKATKKQWLSVSESSVTVSLHKDEKNRIFRVLSVEGTKTLINSQITGRMNFTKVTSKFGQWVDAKAQTAYGLGFASEGDLLRFEEEFNTAKGKIKDDAERNGGDARRDSFDGSSLLVPLSATLPSNGTPQHHLPFKTISLSNILPPRRTSIGSVASLPSEGSSQNQAPSSNNNSNPMNSNNVLTIPRRGSSSSSADGLLPSSTPNLDPSSPQRRGSNSSGNSINSDSVSVLPDSNSNQSDLNVPSDTGDNSMQVSSSSQNKSLLSPTTDSFPRSISLPLGAPPSPSRPMGEGKGDLLSSTSSPSSNASLSSGFFRSNTKCGSCGSEVEHNNSQLEEKIEKLMNENKTMKASNQNLNNALQQSRANVESWSKTLASIREENSRLKQELAILQPKIAQVDLLEARVQQFQLECERNRGELDPLNLQIKEKDVQIAALEVECKKLRESLEERTCSFKALEQKAKWESSQNEFLQQRLKLVEGYKDDWKSLYNKQQTSLRGLEQQFNVQLEAMQSMMKTSFASLLEPPAQNPASPSKASKEIELI